jgi:hypothetical protein
MSIKYTEMDDLTWVSDNTICVQGSLALRWEKMREELTLQGNTSAPQMLYIGENDMHTVATTCDTRCQVLQDWQLLVQLFLD